MWVYHLVWRIAIFQALSSFFSVADPVMILGYWEVEIWRNLEESAGKRWGGTI